MRVEIRGLRFAQDGRSVLAVPSLVLGGNRTTVVFGPNGAGKTTLLRLIAALERPAVGEVLLDGHPVRPDRATRQRIAYAFQEPAFFRGTVRANLELALRLRGVPRAERAGRIREAAVRCEVVHLLERPAGRLSAGEAQRANLARALALRAPVTLLDEPLGRLDRRGRSGLLAELPEVLRALPTTAIIVTHDREEALRLADDLVVLVDGAVRAAGEKAVVLRSVPDADTAAVLGYTLLPVGGGTLAVPPGALRVGEGGATLELAVEAVVDMGHHREAVGRIGGVRVSVPLAPGAAAPPAGARVRVTADGAVRLPGVGP